MYICTMVYHQAAVLSVQASVLTGYMYLPGSDSTAVAARDTGV